VALSGQIIEASNTGSGGGEAGIASAVLADLRRTFQFKHYRVLGTVAGTAHVGSTWTTPLASTGFALEATPRSVDGAAIKLDVRLLRGGTPVVTTSISLAPGGQVLIGGPTTTAGSLIVALSGR
jgi:hypothetical protein